MRKAHYITQNHKSECPTQFIYFDTETKAVPITEDSVSCKLILGYAVYERYNPKTGNYTHIKTLSFNTSQQFWTWIFSLDIRERSKCYIFAHNLGGFDLMVVEFAKYLSEAGYNCQKAVIQCPPTILEYHNKTTDKTFVFVDSLNYFRESLKDLGHNVGIEKTEMPTDDFTKLAEYCKNDVEILRKAMRQFLSFREIHDLGSFKTTTPSQAMQSFRHRFMRDKTLFCDDNVDSLELARKSYHGGRTEAFYLGERTGKFYILDVNSMYPYVMANNYFPTKLKTIIKYDISISDLKRYMKEYFIIADLKVKTDKPKYPVFGDNKRLIFPIGEFDTVICQPEFDFKDILQVNSCALYEQSLIFKEYVNYWFTLKNRYKLENNLPYYHLTKLFLNSLYGKFGQRGFVFETVSTDEPITDYSIETIIDADTGERFTERVFGGIKQQEKRDNESSDSIPSISSAVTSYARKLLWDFITKAGSENCFYVDTDSLLVNQQGYDNLLSDIGDSLGQLKLEKTVDYFNIRGLKDYIFGKTERIKGIRLNTDTTKKISECKYIQDKFRSLKGALREGNVNEMIITRTPKTLKREYTKAVGIEGRLEPIILPNNNNYEEWLTKRYEPKIIREFDNEIDYPQDNWLTKQDKQDRLRERAKKADFYHKELRNV